MNRYLVLSAIYMMGFFSFTLSVSSSDLNDKMIEDYLINKKLGNEFHN